MARIAPGEVLGERYTLKREEWTSPLGPVWLARDRVLDRAVLIQLLSPATTGDDGATRSFLRAAARIAQVTHHGLLQVFDIGTDPPFAVVEHASGGRLAERLRAGPLRPADAARAAIALARGLEALHVRGTWHGSLSPSTVLFDEEGRAKILALGAAEASGASASVDATGEQVAGYRPPEPDPVPVDADRFALAALLYEMVTGRAPDRPPAPARSMRRSVPPEIDALLRSALDGDPRHRPSLDEFVGALAPLARIEPSDVRQPRARASEIRWLVPVVLILVLGGVAATVGVQLVRELAERAEQRPTPSPAATTTALTVEQITDFDPPPGNGEENAEKVTLVIDGDARTAWTTVGYSRERLDGRKQGVGLLIDLGETTPLRRARIQTTLSGWTAEIRVADEPGDRADDFAVVTSFTAATETEVPLPAATRARYVLVWITRVVDDGGGSEYPHSATVSEIELFSA